MNVHSVTGNLVDTEWSVEFGRWKCCREFGNKPRAVVGYGVKIFHPSPPNYVNRSPGGGVHAFSKNEVLFVLKVSSSYKRRNMFSIIETFRVLIIVAVFIIVIINITN